MKTEQQELLEQKQRTEELMNKLDQYIEDGVKSVELTFDEFRILQHNLGDLQDNTLVTSIVYFSNSGECDGTYNKSLRIGFDISKY